MRVRLQDRDIQIIEFLKANKCATTETISNILGHKYVSFTLDTYMHSTVDMQKNVSAYIRDLILEYGDNNEW